MLTIALLAGYAATLAFVLRLLADSRRREEAAGVAGKVAATEPHAVAPPVLAVAGQDGLDGLAADVHAALDVDRVAVVVSDEEERGIGRVGACFGPPKLLGSRVDLIPVPVTGPMSPFGAAALGIGDADDRAGVWTFAHVPITGDGELLGAVTVAAADHREFTEDDLAVLERLARRARRFDRRHHALIPRALLVLTAVAAAAALTGVPASAQAADTCRASAAREISPGQVTSEPVVANQPATPCATDRREAAGVQPVGSSSVAFPRAATRRDPGLLAATASVEGASFPMGGVAISVGAVHATQAASCVDGATVSSGSSRVDALVIDGTTVPIVADQPVDLGVGPLRIRANQLSGETRTALVLDDGTGRELVLGEVTAGGDACSARTGDLPERGSPQICPEGADYDAGRNLCVIHEGGDGGIDRVRETIVVGRPFEGERGGALISLDEARQRATDGTLPASRCLVGAGPDFVVLGSNGRDTITGANTADRILSLGGRDRVSGGVGNDCIDGGEASDRLTGDNGRDRMFGGAGGDLLSGSAAGDRLYGQGGRDVLEGGDGNDRLWGGSGRDAVNGGSGTDRLRAGSGNDTINTGFGRDSVDAGRGSDAINAATAGPASKRIRCGAGRDTLRINRNERRRHRGCERVYTIR